MTGKFKTFDTNTNQLTLGHPPGPDSQHTIKVNPTVTLNGKPSSTADLRGGDNVTLEGDKVVATR